MCPAIAFPPPPSEAQDLPVATDQDLPYVVDILLAEVELTTDPVTAFFHIRTSDEDGVVRTVTKRWVDILRFFDEMRGANTRFDGGGAVLDGCWSLDVLPRDFTNEAELQSNPRYKEEIQKQLSSLARQTWLHGSEPFLEFFQLGMEYQARARVGSLPERSTGGGSRESLFGSPERKVAHRGRSASDMPGASGMSLPAHAVARAMRLLDHVYEEFRSRAERERQEFMRKGKNFAMESHRGQEWNRQEVYLSGECLARVRAASLRHLERHPEWLTGPRRLGDSALCDLIKVQHNFDLDLEDHRLTTAERRWGSAFSGESGHINDQLLLDAPRSQFSVDGKHFCFGSMFEQHGASFEEAPVLKRLFTEELAEAVERSLSRLLSRGTDLHAQLVRGVTTTMSQSGLAHVECALDTTQSQVVVSGGEQDLLYELTARADGACDVKMDVRKHGFENFISVGRMEDVEHMMNPQACSSKSYVAKSCTVRFYPLPDAAVPEVVVDVLTVRSRIFLVDHRGCLMAPAREQLLRGFKTGSCLRLLGDSLLRLCGPCSTGASLLH